MALLSIPNTPDDITPQWLTEALCSTGTLPNVVVTSLCIQPIAEFTCAGQLARLHLSFNQPQSTLMKVSIEIPTELSDGTITIRTHKSSDVHPYFEAVRESVAEVSRHLPWCHQDYSIEEAQAWIEKMIPRFWEQRSEYHFVITDAITGSILGGCGLDEVNWVNQTANLGYWVRTSRTRQGIATAASRLLARFGFEQLRLKRIDVVTSIENVPSARVIEKLNPSEKKGIKDNSPLNEGTSNTIVFSLFPQDIL